MYQDGDIIQIMGKKYVVLGIAEETDFSSKSDIMYTIYQDSEDIFKKKFNPFRVFTTDGTMKVIGHKNKKELKLWLMKNKMLNVYLPPFISFEQYKNIIS